MSSKDDDAGAAIGMMGVGAIFVLLLVYALAAFAAVVLTIVALFAWERPVRFLGSDITPESARAFVGRGLVGMVGFPVFVIFCGWLFDLELGKITGEYWFHIVFGGYVLGSVGVEALLANVETPQPTQSVQPALPAPRPVPAREPQPAPFTYARWDD